jgi:transcriptional regulator with XRE-family HTH domain
MSEAIEELLIKHDLKEESVETYNERFRQGRLRANFSLAQAGAAAGVSLQAIGQFELGKQSMKLDNFLKACDAMKLDVKWVLKGEGRMFGFSTPPAPKRAKRAKMRRAADRTSASLPASS